MQTLQTKKVPLTVDCRWDELSPEMQLQIVRFINHTAAWSNAEDQIRRQLKALCSHSYFDNVCIKHK